MFTSKNPKVTIFFPRKAMEAIFNECDKYDIDETGGRIIGTYRKTGKQYEISVLGIIDPGPNARRSPTSFFQDGEYQERVFREIEKGHPNLEHLGNWHTHHVNGLATLSSGDRATYQRIVNHEKHNTDFFYALLVVRKTPHRNQRYEVKHHVVFRNEETIHEIPESQISLLDTSGPDLSSTPSVPIESDTNPMEFQATANLERVKDQEFFSEFYSGLRAGFSKALGTLYWKGRVHLIDGSHTEVLVMESSDGHKPSYSITIPGPKPPDAITNYRDRNFKSARHAVLHLEKDINREIFLRKGR
jgi:integrative and conjugative element protein (TIGR02256 family)